MRTRVAAAGAAVVTVLGSAAVLTRNRILAFDKTTGVIDATFVPNATTDVAIPIPAIVRSAACGPSPEARG